MKGYKGSFKCQCSRSDYAEGTCVHLHVLFQRLPCFTTVTWDRWTGWPMLGSFLTTYFPIRPIIHTTSWSSCRIFTRENVVTYLRKHLVIKITNWSKFIMMKTKHLHLLFSNFSSKWLNCFLDFWNPRANLIRNSMSISFQFVQVRLDSSEFVFNPIHILIVEIA